jgi:hypothetical protein
MTKLFQGDTDGKTLAEFIESHRNRDSRRRRIETIVKLFTEILRIEREQREKFRWTRESEPLLGKRGIHYSHDRSPEVDALQGELNKRMAYYSGYHVFNTQVPADELIRLTFLATKKIDPAEVRAYNAIRSLAYQGLLSRMRQCQQCRKWFFGHYANQVFCSEKCRIKHSQSDPKWIEQRNQKRRELYRLHKTGKVATKRSHNQTRRKP